jgi:hypothetical protein
VKAVLRSFSPQVAGHSFHNLLPESESSSSNTSLPSKLLPVVRGEELCAEFSFQIFQFKREFLSFVFFKFNVFLK